MRSLVLVLSLVLMAAPALAQGGGPPDAERRARLEEQVRQRFMSRVAQRLELTADQRSAVMEVLREGARERRALARESRELRLELVRTVRDGDAAPETYEGLLERLEAIREREWGLERQEHARLGDVLDARQRALFLVLRMQFNDRVRGMRGPGPHGGPPGPG